MNKEKLQQVIDALKSCGVSSYDGRNGDEIEDQCYDEDLVKEALAIMQAELEKPLPEPLGYVHHEMFAGFVKEPGDASMSCVKLLIPESGYTVPVYAEPTASKREES